MNIMDTVAQTLKAARDLISDPECWCQGALAETQYRLKSVYWKPDARGWCASGAIARVIHTEYGSLQKDQHEKARNCIDSICGMYLSSFNDTHTHAQVIDLIDKAIQRAEEKSL